jgi:hypothetical protein
VETGSYNIVARQGSTFNLKFVIDTDGTKWNLTNYTAAMQVRKSTTSSTAILSLTSGSGITLGGTAGTVAVTASASTMAALPAGTWVYDLELTSGGGITYAVLEGKFIIKPEVTR